MTASAEMTVHTYTPSTGGGSSSGPVTTAASTVSSYNSANGKTASVAITSSTDSSAAATTAVITAQNAASLIDGAKSTSEGLAGISAIEINVLSTGTVKTVSVGIPAASFKELTSDTDADVKISTNLGTIRFSAKAADSIGSAGSAGDLRIRIARAESSILSDAAKAAVGDRPVYSLSVTSGDTTVSDFGCGTATVSVPYTPASGEDVNAIVVYYINASGEPVAVPNCICGNRNRNLHHNALFHLCHGLPQGRLVRRARQRVVR